MAKKIKAYGYYETSSMTGYGITELFDEFSKSTLHLSVSLLEAAFFHLYVVIRRNKKALFIHFPKFTQGLNIFPL